MPKRYRIEGQDDWEGYGGPRKIVKVVQLNNDVAPPAEAVEVPGDTLLHDWAIPVDADYPERQPHAPAPPPIVPVPAEQVIVPPATAVPLAGEGG